MINTVELNFMGSMHLPDDVFIDYPRVDLSEYVKIFEEGKEIRVACTLAVFKLMNDMVTESNGQFSYQGIVSDMLKAYNTNIVKDKKFGRVFKIKFLISGYEIWQDLLIASCLDDQNERYVLFDIYGEDSENA